MEITLYMLYEYKKVRSNVDHSFEEKKSKIRRENGIQGGGEVDIKKKFRPT